MDDSYYACGDQYSASLLDWNGDLRPSVLVNGSSGHIENTFRLNQYGIPANPMVPNPNSNLLPGVDLKSLPHEFKTADLPSRTDMMSRCNIDRKVRPSISDLRDSSMSHNYYDRPLDYYEARPYEYYKEGFNGGGGLIPSDTNTMFLVFMFIIVVFMGMYYWKAMSEIKYMMKMLKQCIEKQ